MFVADQETILQFKGVNILCEATICLKKLEIYKFNAKVKLRSRVESYKLSSYHLSRLTCTAGILELYLQ